MEKEIKNSAECVNDGTRGTGTGAPAHVGEGYGTDALIDETVARILAEYHEAFMELAK